MSTDITDQGHKNNIDFLRSLGPSEPEGAACDDRDTDCINHPGSLIPSDTDTP